jgi:hypothetical protein
VPGIFTITEYGGVRPVYGGVRASRTAHGTDAGPQLHCLSRFGRVYAIRGAFRRNSMGGGPRKDGTRDALGQRCSWVYEPKRNYHVTSSDDTCYIHFR